MPDPDHIVRIGNKTYHLRKRRDGAGMQLVRAQPDDVLAKEEQVEMRRTAAAEAYGNYRPAPRSETPENIDQPVDKRTQTILSYEVDTSTRAVLNGQPGPRPNRGRR
jgi:hypothetical protein